MIGDGHRRVLIKPGGIELPEFQIGGNAFEPRHRRVAQDVVGVGKPGFKFLTTGRLRAEMDLMLRGKRSAQFDIERAVE
ncbi:hypothetical protein D3C86_2082690 [compost metagenome]